MSDIISQKKELRKLIFSRRKEYEAGYLADVSVSVLSIIESSAQFQQADVILAYWAMPDEVQTRLLIEKWSGAKKIYIPSIVGRTLEFRLFEGADKLVPKGKYMIPESVGELLPADAKVDLILVPGVAFTEAGDRIGYGAGYYDGVLKKYPDAYKLGLAFSFQMVDSIPLEPHDMRVDGVVIGGC